VQGIYTESVERGFNMGIGALNEWRAVSVGRRTALVVARGAFESRGRPADDDADLVVSCIPSPFPISADWV
jgi:hypothetical protein